MSKILISDLHMTDHPNDEYRWKIFDWMRDLLGKNNEPDLYILGDITEKKDNHSSKLTNRLLDELASLSLKTIFILKGNHDFTEDNSPFFECSKYLEVTFIKNPLIWNNNFFIPYSKNLDLSLYSKEIKLAEFIFLHAHIQGSMMDNGYVSTKGLSTNIFDNAINCKGIFSGHIHHKQEIKLNSGGKVVYVGSPYPVYFGDNDYVGRVILLNDDGSYKSINNISTIAKWMLDIGSIDELEKIELEQGDQLKIRYILNLDDYSKWDKIKKEIKKYCDNKKVELISLTTKANKIEYKDFKKKEKKSNELTTNDIMLKYRTRENLSDDLIDFGKELMK